MKKTIIIIIALFTVFAAVGYAQYDSLVKSGAKNIGISTVISSLSKTSDTDRVVGQVDALLVNLGQVAGLNQFDPGFLASDNFSSLKDFSIILMRAQNPGRENPFEKISGYTLDSQEVVTSIVDTDLSVHVQEKPQTVIVDTTSVLNTAKKTNSALTDTAPKKITTDKKSNNSSAKTNFKP